MPKILVATGVFLVSSLMAEAKSSTNKNPDYTVRKDSISMNPVDTNKKVIYYPNPFSIILITEEKK